MSNRTALVIFHTARIALTALVVGVFGYMMADMFPMLSDTIRTESTATVILAVTVYGGFGAFAIAMAVGVWSALTDTAPKYD